MACRFAPVLLLSLSLAEAHLDSLLAPKPGLTYPSGENMTIRWTIGNNHNGIDVHLSTDGKTWTTLVSDLAKTQTAWIWKMPAGTLENARIRVCQKSGPAGCTDADSVSNPIDGPLYTLVSGRFRIDAAPTGIVRPAAPSRERLLLPGGFHRGQPQPGSLPRDLRGRMLVLPRPAVER